MTQYVRVLKKIQRIKSLMFRIEKELEYFERDALERDKDEFTK